ncbi:MAG: peptidylprolyl isomerase [Bacteroidetes bacterium]|jgi:peptidyl-prolyl cis-trans isomerase B (cyclophilin B)|nr:peptidylprolyl isomerase [Bacteroidota bacterium]
MKTNFYQLSLLVVAMAFQFLGCGDNKEVVVIETRLGNMELELYDSTPKHKENFIKLVDEGFYDSLLFHRVIPGFMIQGGDPDSKNADPGQRLGMGGPGYTIDAEIGAAHLRGALSAARRGGPTNPEKKSSGSQFYIVTGSPVTAAQLDKIEQRKGITYTEEERAAYLEEGGTPQLDGDYTVYGRLISGFEVAEKIANESRDRSDRPKKDIRMKVYFK